MQRHQFLCNFGVVSAVVTPPPVGFTYTPPFTVYRTGSTFNVGTFDVSSLAPAAGITYYCDYYNGLDTNDGLSVGQPLKRIAVVLLNKIPAGGSGTIYVIGPHPWPSWNQYGMPKSAIILPYDASAKLLGSDATPTWTNVGGGTPNTWQATSANSPYAVYDGSVVDANGDHQALTLQASIANVEANPGSWYLSGTTVYVRTSDSRQPDGNIWIMATKYNVRVNGTIGTPNTIYIENMPIYGGIAPVFSEPPGGAVVTIALKNCQMKYSQGNGVRNQGCATYFQNCLAAKNIDDGFNYHKMLANIPTAVEIDCTGRDNGLADDTDNGSTMHDGGSIVRVNGQYYRNVGRNVHDINANTKSWDLGCYAHDSTSGVNPADFAIDDGLMWLDRCIADGDIEAAPGATLYKRQCTVGGSEIGGGTFTDY